MSRSTRGERVDVLEVHDTQNLAFKYEIVLPAKRAQALNYRGMVRASGNGRFVLVQNATPATSITVVDLQQRKVVSEITTPGCWGILPAASHRLAAVDAVRRRQGSDGNARRSGQVTDRESSEKLFDADQDAWFQHAEQIGDRYWFVSFQRPAHRAGSERSGRDREGATLAGRRRQQGRRVAPRRLSELRGRPEARAGWCWVCTTGPRRLAQAPGQAAVGASTGSGQAHRDRAGPWRRRR